MKHARDFLVITICLAATLGAQSTLLEPGSTTEGQLQGGQSNEYRFTLQAGQYARLSVEQRTINVALACYGPDGTPIWSADSFDIGDTETAEFVGETSGTYRLQITAPELHAPAGRYDITLQTPEPATARHRDRIAAARKFAEGMTLFRQDTRESMLQAVERFKESLANWRQAGDPVEEARTLYTIGLTYIEIGDEKAALEYATAGLKSAQAAKDRKAEGRALNSLAEVENNFGDKRKAIEYYVQALPLMHAAGDRDGEGHTLSNLAVAYSGTGEKRKALSLFEQALEILRDLQDRRMLAEVSGNVGMTYDGLGEYQHALENHQSELTLLVELADRSGQAITLNNIGAAYSGLGAFQKALDAYTGALEINRSLDNRRNIAINLNNIAWVHDNLGDRPRALKAYQEALDLIRAVKDQRTIAVVLNNIAEIDATLGDYKKAVELHNEALALRRAVGYADGEANTLANLGKVYARLGEKQQARDHFEQALSIHRTSGNLYLLGRTLRNLGAFERENGEQERALPHLDEALQLSRRIHDGPGEAEALTELARVERDRNRFDEAHSRADDALAAMESVRLAVASPTLRASFFASARDVQELDIDVLMRLHEEQPRAGFGAMALFASERGKARSLLEMLGEARSEIRRGVDLKLLDRERELDQLIAAKADQQIRLLGSKHTDAEAAASEKELDALTTELEQVQSRIRETSPQYAALTQPVPLDVADIQTKVLDQDTVLLEYALGTTRSFLWVVTPTSLDIFELPKRAEIESASKRVYELLTARNQTPAKETPAARTVRLRQADEALTAAAKKVSGILLQPAAARIGNKRLLIVGEGVLQYLPFAALPDPVNPSPLIVAHEIIAVPSASVVAVLRKETAGRTPAPKTLAVLADPVFSSDDGRVFQRKIQTTVPAPAGENVRSDDDQSLKGFARLRFSRNEADEIARMAPAGTTLKALDFDASRETVLNSDLGQYRIVHFATHSLLHNEHPELSGVVLSLVDRTGRPQNGFLRLYDVYNLRLGSDLVVLSACQTALGGEIKGEGLIGLTRGFLYAGAPRVVASLWEIDDRTTAELMKRFYEGMLVQGQRPAAALRAAQIAMWRNKGWEPPYYWAAFTLQGEWR
jgi:CHAT domain-containing protein/Tfp pilus assembly protein PilF